MFITDDDGTHLHVFARTLNYFNDEEKAHIYSIAAPYILIDEEELLFQAEHTGHILSEYLYSLLFYGDSRDDTSPVAIVWAVEKKARRRLYTNRSSKVRQERKKAAAGVFTKKDALLLKEIQEGKCYFCDSFLNDKYEVDHLVPLSNGGTNWPSNLALSCPACNRSRHSSNYWPKQVTRGIRKKITVLQKEYELKKHKIWPLKDYPKEEE